MDTLPHSRYLAPWGTVVKHEENDSDLRFFGPLSLRLSATHASHPCRGGRAVGGSREREGVSGGQSGDPMAGVVSINEKQHLSKIYFGDIGALQSVGEIRCPQKRRRNYADARRT